MSHGVKGRADIIDTKNPWFPKIVSDVELLPIRSVARLINGFAFKRDDFGENGVPVIRIGDVGETIDLTSTNKYMGFASPILTQFVVRRGDILIAMTGATIGKFGVYGSDEIAYLNQRVGILRATDIDRHYLSACLATRTFVAQMRLYAYGGAQPNIGAHEIGSIIIPVPPIEYQRPIVELLEKYDQRLISAQQAITASIDRLKEYRAALITLCSHRPNRRHLLDQIRNQRPPVRCHPIGGRLLKRALRDQPTHKVLRGGLKLVPNIQCNCPGCGSAHPEIANSTDAKTFYPHGLRPWDGGMGRTGQHDREKVAGLRPAPHWGRKAPDPFSWRTADKTRHNLGSYH